MIEEASRYFINILLLQLEGLYLRVLLLRFIAQGLLPYNP